MYQSLATFFRAFLQNTNQKHKQKNLRGDTSQTLHTFELGIKQMNKNTVFNKNKIVYF